MNWRLWLLAAGCLAGAPWGAQAQPPLETVKTMYAAARYEDALAVLGKMPADRTSAELEQYRVFCLIALGRDADARQAIERLVTADPLYTPDPVETSPRVRERFAEVREEVLPDVVRTMYLEARAALDRKDRADAIARFERVLQVIDAAGLPTLEDMRVLVAGFLDLSRALPAPAPEPAPASVEAADPEPAEPSLPTPAVAISQTLPPWVPTDAVSRRMEFEGAVRVYIGRDGRVVSAEIVRPVHPSYDPLLLKAAREWRYSPATLRGRPIESELVVEVRLRPLQ